MAGPLDGAFIEDNNGDKAYGPVDTSTGEGLAWRAFNRDGDFAAGGIVLEDGSGDQSGVSGNPLYVQEGDGKNVALGATGDGAYTGSGSAGVVGILKGLYVQLAALVTGIVLKGTGIKVAATSTFIADGGSDDVEGLPLFAGRRLCGFSILETSGTDEILVTLRHGTSVAGEAFAWIRVDAGDAVGDKAWGDDGLDVASGVWIERTGSGTAEIVLYAKAVA